MSEPAVFDHEKLDVYRLSVQFLAWVGELVDDGPLSGCRLTAVKHLEDAARSIIANIAEGNGKRSRTDRCRFLDMSRGSALECAACLDVLLARRRLEPAVAAVGKGLLVRIVSMLSKLTESLLGLGTLSEASRDPSGRARASEGHERARTEGETGRTRAAAGRHPFRDA
jgi:four helix bundle protein